MRGAVAQVRTSDGPSVLIVEHDVLVRNPLAEYLRECGYRVLMASSAAEAHRVLAEGEQRVDIVLIDVTAPTDSGFGLATWLRQRSPETKIILASTVAKVVEKSGDLCEEGPPLQKPYDHQLVLRRIKQLVASRDQGPERHQKGR